MKLGATSRVAFGVLARCLALFVLCLLSSAPLLAHSEQIRPVVVEVKPQDTFFTVIMNGNGEDAV